MLRSSFMLLSGLSFHGSDHSEACTAFEGALDLYSHYLYLTRMDTLLFTGSGSHSMMALFYLLYFSFLSQVFDIKIARGAICSQLLRHLIKELV